MEFLGYKRPDGRVGVRNNVLILPASVCASDTTRIISQKVEGTVTFNNQNGCSQVPSDQQLTMDVMAGFAANPNIYGTVVVSLGCENCQMDLVVKAIQERTNKPIKQVIIQESGGTIKAIEKAVKFAEDMVREASLVQREKVDISHLIVGTIGKYVEKYLKGVGVVSTENRLKVLRLIENLCLGTAAVGYRTESMHGAGSPQAQRIMISRQGNLAMKKELAKTLAHVTE